MNFKDLKIMTTQIKKDSGRNEVVTMRLICEEHEKFKKSVSNSVEKTFKINNLQITELK